MDNVSLALLIIDLEAIPLTVVATLYDPAVLPFLVILRDLG